MFVRVGKINDEGNAKQMSKYSQNEKVNEIVVEEWKGIEFFYCSSIFIVLCTNPAVKLIYAIQSAEVGPSVILRIPICLCFFPFFHYKHHSHISLVFCNRKGSEIHMYCAFQFQQLATDQTVSHISFISA